MERHYKNKNITDVKIFDPVDLKLSRNILNFAKEHGIPKDRVHFTNGKDKWETIKRLGIQKHYDNNAEQIDKINKNTDCKGVLVNWKYQ